MGRYSKVQGARATRDSNYIRPWHGLAMIEQTSQGETAKDHAPFDAIELLAIHDFGDLPANNVQPESLAVPSRHRIGESFTDMIRVNSVSHAGNIAGFIKAAMDAEENPTEDDCEFVFGSGQNPLAGKVLEVKAWNVVMAKAKDDFAKEPQAKHLFTKVCYVRLVPMEEVKEIVVAAGTLDKVVPFLPDLAN